MRLTTCILLTTLAACGFNDSAPPMDLQPGIYRMSAATVLTDGATLALDVAGTLDTKITSHGDGAHELVLAGYGQVSTGTLSCAERRTQLILDSEGTVLESDVLVDKCTGGAGLLSILHHSLVTDGDWLTETVTLQEDDLENVYTYRWQQVTPDSDTDICQRLITGVCRLEVACERVFPDLASCSVAYQETLTNGTSCTTSALQEPPSDLDLCLDELEQTSCDSLVSGEDFPPHC